MTDVSERGLILAPRGRDALIAATMLREAGIETFACPGIPALVKELAAGAGFGIITEEALTNADLKALAAWIEGQPEWSDMPFILITQSGGGLERNPAAGRHLHTLGNVTFLERPFHPTTLISLAQSALRGRRRQYEARARLEALRKSEERYRRLFETMDEGFCVIEFIDGPHGPLSDYVHVEANPAYEANAGIPDIVGKRLREIVSASEADAWADIYRSVLISREQLRFERELVETGRHLELAAFPIEDGRGRQVAVLFKDVTDRKRAEAELRELNDTLEKRVEKSVREREAVAAQLHEAQKLETLGQLTGGVAHDFNNLLTPITGALDMLQRQYGESDPRAARLVGNALQAADRAKTLVQRLLGFARRQTLQKVAVDVAGLLDGMRDLISSSTGPTIELRLNARDDLLPALADPNQVELAILNLCVNARDAMPEGGLLTVAAEQELVSPGSTLKIAPGLYIKISVIDTGRGMDAKTLAQAVEPFFSTKETGRGTGLGLSMVHGLAAQLGGGFALASVPGEGTRADLYLPVTKKMVPAQTAVLSPDIKAERSLAILLVDDEDLVRAGTAEMLRDLGHVVTEAGGGGEALSRIAAGLSVDAIITDYMMPRIDGTELARRVRAHHPDMPILLITGYTGTTEEVHELPMLAKPFGQAHLAEALNGLMGASPNVVRFKPRSKA